MDILTFQKRFPTEDACREHLYKIRWPQGLSCPKCKGTEFYKIKTRNEMYMNANADIKYR